ncbi:MAG: divergent polysaccharide deacetylase family protein, partial [Alphaproteobacteria bacterium]|nr:divergent polysaccharide deacetylase family protein [Alphaproteobacteria bacterium]
MFAKRQSVLATTAGAPPARRSLRENLAPVGRILKKPPVAVAGAGLLLLAAAALFITVLGDPRAGAPSARAALKREAAVAPPAPTGLEAFSMGAYGSWQDLAGEAGA